MESNYLALVSTGESISADLYYEQVGIHRDALVELNHLFRKTYKLEHATSSVECGQAFDAIKEREFGEMTLCRMIGYQDEHQLIILAYSDEEQHWDEFVRKYDTPEFAEKYARQTSIELDDQFEPNDAD